jgi:hypothetical protein
MIFSKKLEKICWKNFTWGRVNYFGFNIPYKLHSLRFWTSKMFFRNNFEFIPQNSKKNNHPGKVVSEFQFFFDSTFLKAVSDCRLHQDILVQEAGDYSDFFQVFFLHKSGKIY